MQEQIITRAKAWANSPHIEEEDRQTIEGYLRADDRTKLEECFHRELSFGTGGIRATIGLGTGRINRYTVRRVAQAFAHAIADRFQEDPSFVTDRAPGKNPDGGKVTAAPVDEIAVKQRGATEACLLHVAGSDDCDADEHHSDPQDRHRGEQLPSFCIGFDCRRQSELFARDTARVMAANGMRVHLFDHIVATPLLSYAVRYFKAKGGIMVTASHNPRDYNGLKAYWDDGCQVIPPNDEAIIAHYKKLSSLGDIKLVDFQTALERGRISLIKRECEDSYYERLASQCLNPDLCRRHGPEFPIAFTPLHGTGWRPVQRALVQIGFDNLHPVAEQKEPDENFPTVNPPNPEEKTALEKLVELMREIKAPIALATDPDTDRLGVVAAGRGQDELQFLNGNQIALLMLHYILQIKRDRRMLKENSLLIKTIVTSDLLAQMAEAFGLTVENTLTGFKWICGKIREYEEGGRPFDFVFGTEESFGYLSHDFCRDKDGINACALMAEVALFHHVEGRTLMDALDIIYDRYGYSCEDLLSIYYDGIEGSEKIERIMDYFRHIQKNLPDLILVDDQITLIEDYLHRKTVHPASKRQTDLDLPPSNVLGLHFKSGNKLFMRPSGTEPKIKFYIMVIEKEGKPEEKKRRAEGRIEALKKFIGEKCATL